MINIIVAFQQNDRGIGIKGTLPWHIPEDLKRFKALTSGHPIIMGRKTFDSIGRALPNRTNIVISRETRENADGLIFVTSLEDAIAHAKEATGADEIFVIGGSSIYEKALSVADRLYATVVEGSFPVDTFFPEYQHDFPIEISRESYVEGDVPYHFTIRARG